jgi:nuclear transport factor 2 (NTF2) superfamily protein
MMNAEQIEHMATRHLVAWNSQDVDAVLACYTSDVIYRDPNTRGEVHGSDAMRRYLRKLFDTWQMQWFLRQGYPLQEDNGAAILWQATFQRNNKSRAIKADGMDLVILEGDRIKRNEVYFDRMCLLPVFGVARVLFSVRQLFGTRESAREESSGEPR